MKHHKSLSPFSLGLSLCLGLLLSLGNYAEGTQGIPKVVDPHPYEQLAADTWVRIMAAPTLTNPVFDPDGSFHHVLQPEDVHFLVADLGAGTIVNRSITIQKNTKLFIPIFDVTVFCEGPVEDMRDRAAEIVDATTDLWLTIDGVPVENLWDYRILSNVYTIPGGGFAEDVLPPFCIGDVGIADGYFILLEPLSAGKHVISFGGKSPAFEHSVYGPVPEATLDVTYNIKVTGADD